MNLFDLQPGRFYLLDDESVFEFVEIEPVMPIDQPIFGFYRGTPFGPLSIYLYEGDIIRLADKCEIDAALFAEPHGK